MPGESYTLRTMGIRRIPCRNFFGERHSAGTDTSAKRLMKTETNSPAGSGCPDATCSASLKMSKLVPARTKTLTASWCRKAFIAMSPEYRAIRAKTSKPMDTCYWCRHKFADGEMMALAAVHGSGNKVLCQSCADELLKSLPNVESIHPESKPYTMHEPKSN